MHIKHKFQSNPKARASLFRNTLIQQTIYDSTTCSSSHPISRANRTARKVMVVLFPLLQPLHSYQHLPSLPPPPLLPETKKNFNLPAQLIAASTALSTHCFRMGDGAGAGAVTLAPDGQNAAECPSHQDSPISAQVAAPVAPADSVVDLCSPRS